MRAEECENGVQYTNEFKRLVIYKMLSQPEESVRRLAAEVGVAKSTVWDWKREVCKVAGEMGAGEMGKSAGNGKGAKKRSPKEKLRLAMEAYNLSDKELGEFLRREGIHSQELEQWQDSMLWAVQSSDERLRERKQIRSLERKLRQKEKDIKEANALLKLQKKVQAMWGDEDDDTAPSND